MLGCGCGEGLMRACRESKLGRYVRATLLDLTVPYSAPLGPQSVEARRAEGEAVTYVTRVLSRDRDSRLANARDHRISRRGHAIDTRLPYGGRACRIRLRCSAGVRSTSRVHRGPALRTHGSSNGNRWGAASIHMASASGCSSVSSWRIPQTIRPFSNGSRTKHLPLVRSETGEPRRRPGRRAQVNNIELVVHAL
jgi:hypothetical protein